MAATREGGIKARDKNLAKNPNFYKEIGKIGGSRKGTGGGFAASVDCNCPLVKEAHYKRNCAGKKGGMVKGENYKRATDIQEFQIPVMKPKKRFALWGR